ncbi:MAG: ergothioneine biosynthesis protein EgtB [bacterium]
MNSGADRYLHVRKYTEKIFKPLATEDYIAQPAAFVSPPKWNLGHTTWFFETFLLKVYAPGYRIFDPHFDFLFNSYYNNIGQRVMRGKRGDLTRPTVKEVYAYRKHVDEAILEILNSNELKEVSDILELGLHHEQQHQELFWTDLKYTFGINPLFPAYPGKLPFSENIKETAGKFLQVEENLHEIGYDGIGFCFDNELERHKVFLRDFEISDRLVTNGDYMDFIKDGAYSNFNLWHDEGWKWVNDHKINAPLHWHEQNGAWHEYTLKGLRKLDPALPVTHISFYEASAFAEWKGMRLPTEFEWEAAASRFDWGKRWEWTNSAYLPYPGFKKAPGAVGEYNGNVMVSQMVLRGASVATSPGHSRPTYRTFFHPWERWQFTGIRLAK